MGDTEPNGNSQPTQQEKAERFRALHLGPGAFVLPNPWDAGSARVLAGLGFQALATSSAGFAGTLGRRDGRVTRLEALDHTRAVVGAVDLPVSADLENGFGHAPSVAAETVRLAAETGVDQAPRILPRDHYGWFHRVERGIYGLTPNGKRALDTYADVVATLG